MKKLVAMLFVVLISMLTMYCDDTKGKNTVIPSAPTTVVSACSVLPIANGFTITCGDTSFNVYNGKDGGEVELIDPCGADPGYFNEILIRLPNRTLIAYFLDGEHEFLSIIGEGHYITTDHQACRFQVTTDLEVIEE